MERSVRVFCLFLNMLILFSLSHDVFAKQSTTRKSAEPLHNINELVTALNQALLESQADADIGIYVKSMQYGDALYSLNINQVFTPASTMKVLTAEAALLYLGPEYRFATQLFTDSKHVNNGVLQGNLYIVLSGDPTLTYTDLVELLMNLKARQIHAIAGNVYIDNSAYDQSFYGPGWIWKDRNYCYGAPISASIINHNCVSFKIAPSKKLGRAAAVTTAPGMFYPYIKQSVITKARRSRACSIHLSKDPNNILTIDGCASKGSEAGVSYVIADIPEYNRALFKSLMNQFSINVYGNVTFATAPENVALLDQHVSKPLRVLIHDMLKKSDNIIAGALFKKMGQLYSHRPGSWENGSMAVSQILSHRANVDITNMRVLDGSGLSPDNLTTPSQLMQVLNFAFHDPITSQEFITALPIAGVDGTLKHRMFNITRKIRAKTGTISGVISLAGYALSANHEPLAFVIMINGRKGFSWRYRSLEDRIATILTRYERG